MKERNRNFLNSIIKQLNWRVRLQKVLTPINKILSKAQKTISSCEDCYSALGSWAVVILKYSTYHLENLIEIGYYVPELLWLKNLETME